MKFSRYKRELAAALAYAVLLASVGVIAPSFFIGANLRDLALNNAPVLLVAIGMTIVILVGQIDISVGSQFAVAGVAAGWLAKSGIPILMLLPCLIVIGAAMGAVNGVMVGWLRLPSIIVTLAMLVAWRDALRWITGGEWVQNLPTNFQWFGLGQSMGRWLIVMASLVGLAALLNAVRFSTVPSNAGLGLELKAVAAVVVGGTAITGGRGTLFGTLIGAALLGTIGTALTFVGINPFWEKAIQGAIILAALASDFVLGRLEGMRISDRGLRVNAQ